MAHPVKPIRPWPGWSSQLVSQGVQHGVESAPDPCAPAQRAAGDGCLEEGLAEVFHERAVEVEMGSASPLRLWACDAPSPEDVAGGEAVSGERAGEG